VVGGGSQLPAQHRGLGFQGAPVGGWGRGELLGSRQVGVVFPWADGGGAATNRWAAHGAAVGDGHG